MSGTDLAYSALATPGSNSRGFVYCSVSDGVTKACAWVQGPVDKYGMAWYVSSKVTSNPKPQRRTPKSANAIVKSATKPCHPPKARNQNQVTEADNEGDTNNGDAADNNGDEADNNGDEADNNGGGS
eukprot:1821026-Rhodomonas_salina.6